MAGQLRQRGTGAPETNVQELDERVLLRSGQIHHARPFTASFTALTSSSAITGLVTNPTAPASDTRFREDVWMSAVTTMTRAEASISRNLLRTSRPYMPFMTRSSS